MNNKTQAQFLRARQATANNKTFGFILVIVCLALWLPIIYKIADLITK